jgi:predicted dehydrogenase
VPEQRVRVGVIGCGISIFHLEGLQKEPRAETIAIAGLDTDRCLTLQKQFDVPRRYGDYRELLAADDIDVVTVAVPNHLHAEVTIAALEAGKHVLVEKPLANSSAEGERMVAAAHRTGLQLGIIFNRRGRHDLQIVKHEVERGAFGEIYHAKAFWMRRAGIPGIGTWFTRKELSGGGPLIDLGVHVLDMALWVMGNPRAVCVSAATYNELGTRGRGQWQGARFRSTDGGDFEVEDFATALIRFEGGMTLQLDASWAGYTRHGDEFGVSFMGDAGGAEIHVVDYAETGTLKIFGEVDGAPAVIEPRLLARHGHGSIISDFVTAIQSGTPFSPSGEEGLDRVRLIEAIYRSAENGHEVTIA